MLMQQKVLFASLPTPDHFTRQIWEIYGGDFVGNAVVPIIKTKDGYYEATYYGSTVKIKNEGELPDLQKTLRDAGFTGLS
jgi:hypothetical protein